MIDLLRRFWLRHGIALAIGEVIDDAIVDMENVYRRLKENQQLPNPQPVLEVIYHASSEVRNSIVFSTALVLALEEGDSSPPVL